MIFTDHAQDQLWHRFKLLTREVEDIYKKAIPFGIQKGKSLMLLNEDVGCVFVVQDNIIITVLTKELAIANMQSKYDFQVEIASISKEELLERERVKNTDIIQKIAEEMFEEYGDRAGSDSKSMKGILDQKLVDNEVIPSFNRKECLKAIYKLIYKHNKKLDKTKY